jgi:hypothetical protein
VKEDISMADGNVKREQERAWIVKWTFADPSRNYEVVFLDEEKAVREAAESAYQLAKAEIENYGIDDNEDLNLVISLYKEGNYYAAMDYWGSYSEDVNSEESVDWVMTDLVR